jgi:hypothetical protein
MVVLQQFYGIFPNTPTPMNNAALKTMPNYLRIASNAAL